MDTTERATELLTYRATEGLEPIQQQELDELLPHTHDLDPESFELAAAAIELAVTQIEEPLPATLRARLSAQAQDFFEQQPPVHAVSAPPETPAPSAPSASSPEPPAALSGDVLPFPSEKQASADPTRWLGWLVAALLLVAVGLWPKGDEPQPGPVIATPDPVSVPEPVPPTPAEERDSLVSEAQDLVQLAWTATDDPAAQGATGEVVWSNEAQRGFMTFRGLKVNDPTLEQYQLWIFDAQQDERHPIDGGVFNVAQNDSGEVVVEIDAKLAVIDPTLFAITVEKPGGVVVSSRERLPLLAKVEA